MRFYLYKKHTSDDLSLAVQAGAVREAGADTAACIIVFVRQRAPTEVGFSNQLSGFVIGQMLTFTYRVNDYCLLLNK